MVSPAIDCQKHRPATRICTVPPGTLFRLRGAFNSAHYVGKNPQHLVVTTRPWNVAHATQRAYVVIRVEAERGLLVDLTYSKNSNTKLFWEFYGSQTSRRESCAGYWICVVGLTLGGRLIDAHGTYIVL